MAQLVPPELSHAPSAEGPADPRVLDVARARAWRRWLPSAKVRVDLLRRLLGPSLLILVPLFWVVDATHRASLTTVGRDQGIFQYIAWAVANGAVDYRDIRDVNGPLVHLIHSVFLALGGADEHRFHILDLWATGLSFAFVGACLPGLVSKRAPTAAERAAWAAAAWVVLSAQYMLYIYWNQAQRESFCDWFLLPSLALQAARPATSARAASWRIQAIAALSTIAWFGKPTFAVFSVMQLGVLLVDREIEIGLRTRLRRFVLGGAMGAVLPLSYLAVCGDVRAWARITFIDVPHVYRFIWAKSVQEIFGEEGAINAAALGLAATATVLGLVVLRELPRRALVIALAPLAGIVSIAVQHKGFGYHFHPLTASTHIAFLLVVVLLWERVRSAPRDRRLGRLAVLAVTAAYALEITSSMKSSPHSRNVWILAGGETAERRTQEEYFESFKTYDFFPWDLRQAGAYLREKTSRDGRVQLYGMDPYLLFLAERKSATPYIYAYDLNDDAALDGGWSNQPTDGEKFRIRVARASHEQDMLEQLRAAPPEAFVFIDRSPLMSHADAWEDFRYCCSESSRWVASRYHPAKSFGVVHVWMRDDMPGVDVQWGLPPSAGP